ncbi:MAG: calcium-binding protein, partial [Planktomarina sp.]
LDGRTYDIAYSAKDDAFYAVESAGSTGGSGAVHKIDLSGLEDGEAPTITSIPITGTLIDGEMHAGMASGPNGAVFLDGDGNLYYGMNNGDHDMDATTANDGGIFQVSVDWDAGTAYTEFVADAQACGGNDGAVDPRAPDPFAPVDSDASFLIREPVLVPSSGGDDDLRGGDGDDLMYGGGGDDVLHGGNDDDVLHGDGGGDRIFGGSGDDTMLGGEGRDKLLGGTGDDDISGGADRDYIHGGSGDDIVDGGAGADKLVGGAGSDTIIGGAGTDQMWGGDWGADGAADTFVVSAGGGKDLIHDFEVGTDILDLSSYGIEFNDLAAAMTDKGWATEIDLSALTGGEVGDKVILKSVETDDLDESNFLL